MSGFPPSWAMGAVGIDGSGDPHLPEGIHLRVFVSPECGLPICPIIIYRVAESATQDSLAGVTRTDFAWIDSRDRVLSLPFTVTPDNPVRGIVLRGAGERAIAAAVHATSSGRGGLADANRPRRTVTDDKAALKVSAYIDAPGGRRMVGERTSAPYMLAAPHIDGLLLEGSGTVSAAAWVMARDIPIRRLKPHQFMDLPIDGAARYLNVPGAAARAEARVRRGAPQRFGLHDDPSVPAPASAAAASPDDEWSRVEPLSDELLEHLKAAVDDLSLPPERVTRSVTLTDGVASAAGVSTADVVCQSAVQSSTADPGLARWLGFMDADISSPTSGAFVIYYVRAFVAIDTASLDVGRQLTLAVTGPPLSAPEAVPGLPFPVPHRSADDRPVYDFVVPVLVFRGAPPARPATPEVGAPLAPSVLYGATGTQPLQTGDALGTWVSEVIPPAALRELTMPLAGLSAAPTLAVARREFANLTPLNERHPVSGRALALVPAVPDQAVASGTGRYVDRAAPPGPVTYRIAQADWWGRWSDWAERDVTAKPSAPPPTPVLSLQYTVADIEPIDDAPRFGELAVRLTVPRADDLAAGSRLLTAVRITGTVGGAPVTVDATLPSSAPATFIVRVPGPAGMIDRSGNVEAVLTARWFDGTQYGDAAEAQRRTLADPRPPAAVVLDPTLRYTARPDAVGRARIVLSWTGQPGRRYRVYNTDETRLADALRARAADGDAAAATLMAAVDAAPDPAFRGQAWTDPAAAALFGRDLFTNLTDEPIAGTSIRFQHDLSGSLTVLSFFKVVALSEDNVESVFTDATLLPVAVPSGGPPPRPLLDFERFDDTNAAHLRVTAVRGTQPAARWRLRRSVAESADALRMPLVAEGMVPDAGPGADGPNVFTIVDAGADDYAGGTLPPWTRMSWRVEVQAPSPPGTTLPGEWSPASGAVSSVHLPSPPLPATDLTATSDGTTVSLTWTHPESLRRGAMGAYRFDVYRRLPDAREERIGTVAADDPTAVSGSGTGRTFRFDDPTPGAAGTTRRVVTVDPAGRLSAPSIPVTLS